MIINDKMVLEFYIPKWNFIPRQWRPRWDSTVPSFGIACEKKMQSSGDNCESVDVLLWVFISILLYIICAHRLILCVNSPGELFSQREDFLNLYMCFKNPKFDPDKDNASVEYSVFSDFRYCDVRNKMAAPMDLMFGSTTQLISSIYSYQNYLTLPWSCSFKVISKNVILTHPVVLSLMFIFMQ